MSPAKNPAVTNKLLAALPKKDYEVLQRHLEEVPLLFAHVIYESGGPITDVYFPNSGIISVLAGSGERSTLEVGLVGKEGMIGLGAFLGVNSSHHRAVVQGAGSALKMKARHLREAWRNDGALPRVLLRYSHSVLTQMSQLAVCNQFHALEARLARWLLMTHDRIDGDEFQITQNFLSNMLGVRREGVSVAAGTLQKLGLIHYSRGRLTMVDRTGLEAKSCSCYGIMKNDKAAL